MKLWEEFSTEFLSHSWYPLNISPQEYFGVTGAWAASGEGWEYAVAFEFDLRSGRKCWQSFKQGTHII